MINTELALADLETVDQPFCACKKQLKGRQSRTIEIDLLERIKHNLTKANLHGVSFTKEEHPLLDSFHLLTLKPTLYAANVSEKGFTIIHY